MRPTKETKFLPLTDIKKYCDTDKYFCTAVVFSPETENEHFTNCPPYIRINDLQDSDEAYFFEVPYIIAYYAKTHPCYTYQGKKNDRLAGKRELANEIKHLLNI